MHLEKDKILKLVLTLLGVLFLVITLRFLSKKNSITLSEYAEEHPDRNTPVVTEEPILLPSQTIEENPIESDAFTNEADAGFQETITLIGSSLNGDSQLENRITYQDGFYIEPLSEHLKRYITGVTYPDEADLASAIEIDYEKLRYIHILHYDFDGNPTQGELICNVSIAQDLSEIFYELYVNEYQIEKVHLVDEYDGDDTISMEENNTSCFNYRPVAGSSHLSQHAYGLAVDVNPFYNPYITYDQEGTMMVSPEEAVKYADRTTYFPYKIDENDLCFKLFQEHGFTWGGNWNSVKDYQHFQKKIN